MQTSVFHSLAKAAQNNEPVALGIISGVKGSSPQKAGAKALFYSDGRIESTLGGGCLEAEIQQRAIRSLQTGESSSFELLLDHDFGWDDGLICGGKVFGLILPNAQKLGEEFWNGIAARKATVAWGVRDNFQIVLTDPRPNLAHLHYQEIVEPPCHLWIAGAGHIAQAVAPLALQLDFCVSVFDDRPSLANHKFFQKEVTIFVDDWSRLFSAPVSAIPTFGLIVTRGHRHDAIVLRDWIHKPFRFLGMIGSSRKARIIREHFLEEKIATPDQLQRVFCPVGVEIKSQSVVEIAVSIAAQLIEKRAVVLREN